MAGTIGSAIASIDAAVVSFLKYKITVQSDAALFLSNWKRDYRLHQMELRRLKAEESVVGTNSTLEVSTRPSRSARLTARMNIKKQAEEENVFLKPQAVPRTKKVMKRIKETAEIKTDAIGTSEVILDKPSKSRTKTKAKNNAKVSEEVSNQETESTEISGLARIVDDSAADDDRTMEQPSKTRTKIKSKKTTKEIAIEETDSKNIPHDSDPKIEKTLTVSLEKISKTRTKIKGKKHTKVVEEVEDRETECMDTSEPAPLVEASAAEVEKSRKRTKVQKKSQEIAPIEPEYIPSATETLQEICEAKQTPEEKIIETARTSGMDLVENSPPISPVLFPDDMKSSVVNETFDEENDKNLVNICQDEPKSKKRKGTKNKISDLIFVDASVNLNQSISAEKSLNASKLKRKKFRPSNLNVTYENFEPKANSSILKVDMNQTRTVTPKNKSNVTFVVNTSGQQSSPFDIFAEGAETVVRNKKPKESNIAEEPEPVEFQAPLPVASKKRKTSEEVNYDALGNVIDRDQGARTKVINGATFECLPNADDGRPVRIRTKVRRFGVDGEGEKALEHSNVGETSQRVKRTKKKSGQEKAAENLAIKEAMSISRKSKARRASAIMSKIALSKLPSSSTKKYKTPLSTVTNQFHGKRPMIIMNSASKDFPSSLKKNRIYEVAKVMNKPSEEDLKEERQAKFKNKKDKEDHAALKKIEELNRRQEQLKQKNKEKLARAKECRAKIEEEKHEMIVQTEKEKEMKRKLLLQEREEKLKAEVNKKRMLAEKKLAELEERRRMEEEMRLAKIREIEMEQKRQEQERQRQIELEEKRARERLEEKKKMMEADKLLKMKMAHAAKAQSDLNKQKRQYEGMYLPRNENDFGLEDELSENSDEEEAEPSKRPVPKWVQGTKKGNPLFRYVSTKQIKTFMPIRSVTPNVQQLFNVSPRRVRTRKSSAVWNTTVASPF